MAGTRNHNVGNEPEHRYDVFISHSSRRDPDDHELVDTLADELRRRGLRVFLDRTDLISGRPLFPSIQTAINRSAVGIVVLSRKALASGWFHFECQIMKERKVSGKMRVLALRLESASQVPCGIDPKDVIDPSDRYQLADIVDRIARVARQFR